jgi:NADP-dependent 3-hydroxy acid dehydrogenase YdfG
MRSKILITGASAGLGAEMARQFAAKGRDLALCARRLDRLEALRAELVAARPDINVAVRELDVTDDDAVFRVFAELAGELGGLDRVIVNAGLGKGAPLGTGRHYANRQTAMTNFVGALAQCEAALEHFRAADAGHLVIVSSMSALRGMPGTMTTYAATKSAVATLADGIRADVYGTPIKVTTLFPGYIASEMNSGTGRPPPLLVDTVKGVRAMVAAIEREAGHAAVPPWPWRPLGVVLRHVPTGVLRKLAG